MILNVAANGHVVVNGSAAVSLFSLVVCNTRSGSPCEPGRVAISSRVSVRAATCGARIASFAVFRAQDSMRNQAAGVACALLSAGCGYALAGRGSSLPEYIKVIGIEEA